MAYARAPLEDKDAKRYSAFLLRIVESLELAIKGKRLFLEQLVIGLAAGGHVLIEDLPGLGKTTVAKALSSVIAKNYVGKKSAGLGFKRIQFTPDLLPYDITGVDVYDPATNRFAFRPGPIFANIVLADEINRTTPKVQSALLEGMAERQVTVGTKTHKLADFFFVIATQNPVEVEGTYPLPAAQLDRFLMRLSLGYPEADAEIAILREDPAERVVPTLTPVCGIKEITEARAAAERVWVDPKLERAIVELSEATRRHPGVLLGVSPRGSLMLLKTARACALLRGRAYATDQDILDTAALVLPHRIKMKDARLRAEPLVREEALACLERAR